MTGGTGVTIRKFEQRDRSSVRRICAGTALMGEPGSAFFDDDEVLADALSLYFTDHEPQSCLVAEDSGRVVGYLFGAINEKSVERAFSRKILFPLLVKTLTRGVFFRRKNLVFFFYFLMSAAKGEFTSPDFSKEYPATLHINIEKEYRAIGIGAMLISAYLGYLKGLGVAGVHFATVSEKAGTFFAGQGFSLLSRGRRTYFRYFLHKEITLHIYGMKL